HRLDEVLDSLGGMPVLTVSDIESFTTRGGIIRLRMIDNRVRFDINTAVAGNAGLSISSKLLSLATSVETEQ
ncbi:MAG: YfiR family protein, partial [Thiohalobacterales bacterium]|nr:YfiR family protein [Thiohalobacterales bacterium]